MNLDILAACMAATVERAVHVKQIFSADGLCYLQFEHLAACPELVHGIFTRLGGHSAAPFTGLNTSFSTGDDYTTVMKNRQLMARALDIDRERTATVAQAHGCDVCIIGKDWTRPQALPRADILITTRDCNYHLVMAFADCAPLLLYDRRHGVIALAHAGWRGTAQGVALHTVRALIDRFTSDPADLLVGIGPAIGMCCYEVGNDVYKRFQDNPTIAETAVFTEPTADGHWRLDLWESNRRQLIYAGVPEAQIAVAGICTACHTDLFFSHRREQGHTGRFPVVIGFRNQASER